MRLDDFKVVRFIEIADGEGDSGLGGGENVDGGLAVVATVAVVMGLEVVAMGEGAVAREVVAMDWEWWCWASGRWRGWRWRLTKGRWPGRWWRWSGRRWLGGGGGEGGGGDWLGGGHTMEVIAGSAVGAMMVL